MSGDTSWTVSVTDSDGRSSTVKVFTIRIVPFNKVPILNLTGLQNYIITRNSTPDTSITLKEPYVTDADDSTTESHVELHC